MEAEPIYRRTDYRDFEGASGGEVSCGLVHARHGISDATFYTVALEVWRPGSIRTRNG